MKLILNIFKFIIILSNISNNLSYTVYNKPHIKCINLPINNINNCLGNNDYNNDNNNVNFKNQLKVYLHLEKFSNLFNLLHIGISFTNTSYILKYDYRPFSKIGNYLTINTNLTENIYYNFKFKKKIIFWGYSNKSFQEIIEFEKSLNNRYILGIYDCRHYVRHFSSWALNKPTPVWKLKKLWKLDKNNSDFNITLFVY